MNFISPLNKISVSICELSSLSSDVYDFFFFFFHFLRAKSNLRFGLFGWTGRAKKRTPDRSLYANGKSRRQHVSDLSRTIMKRAPKTGSKQNPAGTHWIGDWFINSAEVLHERLSKAGTTWSQPVTIMYRASYRILIRRCFKEWLLWNKV